MWLYAVVCVCGGGGCPCGVMNDNNNLRHRPSRRRVSTAPVDRDNVTVSVNGRFILRIVAKPPMRCVGLRYSETRKEKFSGPGESCQRNVSDLAGSLVTSSRPPGRLQNRPDDRTWNADVAVRTADGSRRTADTMSEVWMQQSVMYCGKVLPATRQMYCAAVSFRFRPSPFFCALARSQ